MSVASAVRKRVGGRRVRCRDSSLLRALRSDAVGYADRLAKDEVRMAVALDAAHIPVDGEAYDGTATQDRIELGARVTTVRRGRALAHGNCTRCSCSEHVTRRMAQFAHECVGGDLVEGEVTYDLVVFGRSWRFDVHRVDLSRSAAFLADTLVKRRRNASRTSSTKSVTIHAIDTSLSSRRNSASMSSAST